jgi:uncharacterized protein YndB with AHSA1/START domain
MSEYGEVIEAGTVRFERLLPGPIERVWKHLTDSELRGTWFAAGPMEPRVGGSLTLHFRHQNLTDHDEVIPEKFKAMEQGITMESRITRWDPPQHLGYTWDDGSEVSFDLEQRGKQVLLTLTHRALASRDEMINVAGGWHSHLDVLTERLSGKNPAPFWPRVERYEREYPARIK